MVTISNRYLYNILTQYTLISICLKDVCKVGMVVNTDNPITQETMSKGSWISDKSEKSSKNMSNVNKGWVQSSEVGLLPSMYVSGSDPQHHKWSNKLKLNEIKWTLYWFSTWNASAWKL